MNKKIAIINDLSGFGRCSLTAAISVISAMGVQPCPLPTAILSAQTGYPSYYCDDYTDKMEYFRSEWEKMKVSFDGIYTGFVASQEQIDQIFRFIDTFYTCESFLLVDPVMGDHGHTYDMFTEQLRRQMKKLTLRADIITPNVTELCLLTETDYHTVAREEDPQQLLAAIDRMGKELCAEGPGEIIVTGIRYRDPQGTELIGNLSITPETTSLATFPYVGESYSGTGDLFASCLAGGLARGDAIPDIVKLTGEFLCLALHDSVREQVPRNDGVNYEKYLSRLMPQTP